MSKTIIELFDRAATKLKWPNLIIKYGDEGRVFKFSRAGSTAKLPGSINITNGGPFGNNIFYGRINRDGTIEFRTHSVWHKREIEKIIANPIEYSQINGKRYNICCFCGIELTSPNSVFYGYGPICAANWGLPWQDGGEREKEQDLIELLEKSGVKK